MSTPTTEPVIIVETAPPPTVPTTEPCFEDEACWDCSTMGNHICGAVETTPPCAEPCAVATTPAVRGEPIYLGTTPAGECVSGSTQFTFEPCDVTTTTALAVEQPIHQELPATGNSETFAVIALTAVILGAALRRVAR